MKSLSHLTGMFAASICGAAGAVALFGSHTYHWRAFDIEAGIAPSVTGETRLIFMPLGEVRARTHSAPIALRASLRAVSFDDLKRLIQRPPPRSVLEDEFLRAARSDLLNLAERQVLLGCLGALLSPALFHARRARYWLFAPLCGGGFVAALLMTAFHSFDPKAFETPVYTGSLKQANWIIALVKDGFNRSEALADKLRRVASNINTLYGRINAIPGQAAEADAIRILHISDIHNNPAAVQFVVQLAAGGKIDAVVDTGDLTDMGTPLETHLSAAIRDIPAPYLFVAGNHDSQATVKAVAANRNAVILHDMPVRVAGLAFLGAPDPSSARLGPGSVDTPRAALLSAAARLAERYRGSAERPDVVCVHDPLQAQSVVGIAPVILCGHEHRAYIEVKQGSVVCNAGTTGAAGVRYLDRTEGVPLSAEVLSFSRSPVPRLLFIDQVSLDGSLGAYTITRRAVSSSLGAQPVSGLAAPAPG